MNRPDDALDRATVDRLLGTTRSVRRKLDLTRPVANSLLLECIQLATQAPMGTTGEHWRFVIVTEPERKAALAALYAEALAAFQARTGTTLKATQTALLNNLPQMPALIFVCTPAPAVTAELGAQIGYYGSVLPAAWSLMLALRSRGLGTTWTSLLATQQTGVAEILELPADVIHTVMFPVAHSSGAVLKPADRLPAQAVTFFERWPETEQD